MKYIEAEGVGCQNLNPLILYCVKGDISPNKQDVDTHGKASYNKKVQFYGYIHNGLGNL